MDRSKVNNLVNRLIITRNNYEMSSRQAINMLPIDENSKTVVRKFFNNNNEYNNAIISIIIEILNAIEE